MNRMIRIGTLILAICVIAVTGVLYAMPDSRLNVSAGTIEYAEEIVQSTEEPAAALAEVSGNDDAADNQDNALESEYTERDMNSDPDISDADYITVSDNDRIEISAGGTYVLSGTALDAVIIIDADKESDKVQLVLDGLNITNEDFPAIYVRSADKVFITTAENSENSLIVSGTFISDGEINTDGVIFSKDDITLNGKGTLNIDSSYNGIVGKDDIKITGGTYNISSVNNAIEAKDTISICGGTFRINAGSTGIQSDAVVLIDGGELSMSAKEGIEATYVLINSGDMDIYGSDDGINATMGSSAYDVAIEINGGNINVEVGAGDTDGLDSNGCIYINGGTVNVIAQSAFDFDYLGELNGGNVYVNGEQVYELTNAMMGGRGQRMNW